MKDILAYLNDKVFSTGNNYDLIINGVQLLHCLTVTVTSIKVMELLLNDSELHTQLETLALKTLISEEEERQKKSYLRAAMDYFKKPSKKQIVLGNLLELI